ncbi:MAG: hydantoinase/oxoprolinase family protein [Chloroflexaceae bacterium]|nr:hydantoinase/oxoprolinase family protein [Chloroflexaceae bacterium]NJO05375.1 hydantoinase/oxoprolinase family protein [Chloroflexaceae bacterium]
MAYRVGVDVGGTFTDMMLLDEDTGKFWRVKTPSTPHDPSEAVLTAITRICEQAGVDQKNIAQMMHGTTVATNVILEGKGARVGLVTTEGFKQILHLARSQTPGPLAGWIIMIKPDPPASLADTAEVHERMSARGEVVRELDEAHAEAAIRSLVESGIESLTISLINSFANPAHERTLKAIAKRLAPTLPVTISADVLPEFREYERTLTAAMNAYVRPKVEHYLANLEQQLEQREINARVNILRSDAGLMTLKTAEENPVYAILSGPSGGVAGALQVALRAGYPNILTLDMGGTSTDVSLCRGEPSIARETRLGYFPVKVPSVDVHSVGAGGGSIAHVPELTRALRVGPQSAGAVPGPASYGRGGAEPTVTDANVVCGYLPPKLLGGEMSLDVEAAKRSVQKIADAMGLDLYDAAEGILKIVNENMFGALRLVSVQRGFDPREFALMAFGGAGPLHGNALAALMGAYPVIIPPAPGLLCAMGDLSANFRDEFARTYIRTVDMIDREELTGILRDLGEEAKAMLSAESIPADRQDVQYSLDLRYYLQGYEIPISVQPDEVMNNGIGTLVERFHQTHDRLYGFQLDSPVEVVNVRAVGIGRVSTVELPEGAASGADASAAHTGTQQIYRNGEWREAGLYDRALLKPGNVIEGPAIITELDSTTVVLPNHTATVDTYFNLLINPMK